MHQVSITLLQIILLPILDAQAEKPLIVENGAVCENKATGFLVLDNTFLSTADSIVYKDTPEQDCFTTCSTNRDQFGRSILCASFVYDHSSFTCTIFKEKAKPEGKADVVQVVGKRYFEKVCLGEEVPKECADSQFIRADDSVLIGFARNVTLVETMEQCVGQCVQEKDCKSAMYFYEEGECITNSESALSKPSSFAKEENEKVVYFQNGCLTKIKAQESSFASALIDSSSSTESPDNVDDMRGDVSEEEETEEGGTSEMTSSPVDLTTVDIEASTSAGKVNKKGEKASYIKYKKHPKSYSLKASKLSKREKQLKSSTVDLTNGDGTDDRSIPLSSLSTEEEMTDSVDADEGDETTEELAMPSGRATPSRTNTALEREENEQIQEFPTYFSEWSDWTACTKAGERQIRRRKCLNLRRCLGALMQLRNCPAVLPDPVQSGPMKSVRSVIDVPRIPDYDDTDGDQFAVRPTPSTVQPEAVWSSWQGVCQHFVSAQPCNNGEMIGFESRECIARDPSLCEGPFFRYCTLPC